MERAPGPKKLLTNLFPSAIMLAMTFVATDSRRYQFQCNQCGKVHSEDVVKERQTDDFPDPAPPPDWIQIVSIQFASPDAGREEYSYTKHFCCADCFLTHAKSNGFFFQPKDE